MNTGEKKLVRAAINAKCMRSSLMDEARVERSQHAHLHGRTHKTPNDLFEETDTIIMKRFQTWLIVLFVAAVPGVESRLRGQQRVKKPGQFLVRSFSMRGGGYVACWFGCRSTKPQHTDRQTLIHSFLPSSSRRMSLRTQMLSQQ